MAGFAYLGREAHPSGWTSKSSPPPATEFLPELRLSRRDTLDCADLRLDRLTFPACFPILKLYLHTCVADAYNGQGYDREGAHW